MLRGKPRAWEVSHRNKTWPHPTPHVRLRRATARYAASERDCRLLVMANQRQTDPFHHASDQPAPKPSRQSKGRIDSHGRDVWTRERVNNHCKAANAVGIELGGPRLRLMTAAARDRHRNRHRNSGESFGVWRLVASARRPRDCVPAYRQQIPARPQSAASPKEASAIVLRTPVAWAISHPIRGGEPSLAVPSPGPAATPSGTHPQTRLLSPVLRPLAQTEGSAGAIP